MACKVACLVLALAVVCLGYPQGELGDSTYEGLSAFGPGSNGDYGIFGGPGSNGHHGVFGGAAWNGGNKERAEENKGSVNGHDKQHQYQ